MNEYEKVEKLREKANVSYEEAKAALEKCNWDLLDAIVLLEREGKIFVIRPQEALSIKRLEKDPKELERVYNIGLADGEKTMKALKAYLGK